MAESGVTPTFLVPLSATIPLINEQYCEFAKVALANARHSIVLNQFIIDCRPEHDEYGEVVGLLTELIRAKAEGVSVKISLPIVRSKGPLAIDINQSATAFLRAADVPVQRKEASKHSAYHSKVLIVDERILIVGSHNWTPSAFRLNSEVSIAVNSEAAARAAEQLLRLELSKD